jgi:uncharacterized membrane protein
MPTLRKSLSSALIWASIFTWIIVVGRLVVHRHNNFATFDFDLGIHDQSLWLLANGKWFNTVCGLTVFGHHAMFMYYFLVPFVWLGGGPNLWNMFQVAALACAAYPVFLIARHRLKSEISALAFGIAWLLLPTTAYLAWETFHPETMAIPFLLMGYHYATSRPEGMGKHVTRHNIITVVWIAIAMLWKEDISLAVMGLGILLMFRKRIRFGAMLFAGATLYFLIFAVWFVPHLAGELSAYGALYGNLGTTPSEVVKTSLRHPSLFIDRLSDNNAIGYAGRITSPLGFLPFLAPLTLLMGIPQFFINILTTADFTWAMMYHYQAVPNVAAIAAAIEGAAFLQRRSRSLGRLGVAGVVVCAYIAANSWGLLPFGAKYNIGYWPHGTRDNSGWVAALDRVGPTDVVSAHYALVPHAAQREIIYTFPNPWIKTNFLNDDSKFVSPSKVKWIVVKDGTLGQAPQDLLNQLLARGEYGDAQTVAGITSYKRLIP